MAPRYRVLAVDDTADTLELIRMTLRDEYDVLTLSNPMDLYELLDVFEPDLLILDVMMPRITGFQLIELLQKNPGTKDLPIIILSAKDSTRDIKHGYKLGADLYLTKPFQPERLLKNVKTQFEVHPPAPRTKSQSLDNVLIQLQTRAAFKAGTATLASSLLDEESVMRQKAEDDETRSKELLRRFEKQNNAKWEG